MRPLTCIYMTLVTYVIESMQSCCAVLVQQNWKLCDILQQIMDNNMLRPYHPESTPSRPIREVKLDWAQLILG